MDANTEILQQHEQPFYEISAELGRAIPWLQQILQMAPNELAKTLQSIPQSKYWGMSWKTIQKRKLNKLRNYLIKLSIELSHAEAQQNLVQEAEEEQEQSEEEEEFDPM